jgi:hypothetical protein
VLHVILSLEWGDLYYRTKLKTGRFTSVNGMQIFFAIQYIPGEDFEEFTVG